MCVVCRDNKHIKINFFGIKLNIKHFVNQQIFRKFMKKKVLPKTILLIELNDCHYETMPHLCKYCLDCGYNVDILTRDPAEKIFENFVSQKVRVYECNYVTFDKIYKNYDFSVYERIIYNSKRIYQKKRQSSCNGFDISECYKQVKKGRNKNIFLQHHIDKYYETPNDLQIILANPSKRIDLNNKIVNCHYFQECTREVIQNKNDIVNFISIGELSNQRKNTSLLINAVKYLHSNNITNFKITIIGRGCLENVSNDISGYFNILGRVDYQIMFDEIRKSDFILPLLDPEIDAHRRYMDSGTSGTFQLVYGFLEPCIIHKTFADIYDFNEHNSLIYEQNQDLANSMIKAINMKQEEYINLQNNLKEKVKKIENQSLENLSNILKKFGNNYNKYDIISLGEDCMVRRYLTLGGLKKTKAKGELTCPFDLSFTTVESIIKILETDFSDYFEDLEFSVEDNYWINKKYNIGYNHDLDCRENDKNKLINRFMERIKNFRKIVKTSPYIYFVCKTRCTKKSVLKLYASLKRFRPNLPFKLLILDIDKKTPIIRKRDIKIIKIKHPFKTRNDWWQDIDSNKSIIFQQKICNAVKNEISKDFTINHYLKEDENNHNGNY